MEGDCAAEPAGTGEAGSLGAAVAQLESLQLRLFLAGPATAQLPPGQGSRVPEIRTLTDGQHYRLACDLLASTVHAAELCRTSLLQFGSSASSASGAHAQSFSPAEHVRQLGGLLAALHVTDGLKDGQDGALVAALDAHEVTSGPSNEQEAQLLAAVQDFASMPGAGLGLLRDLLVEEPARLAPTRTALAAALALGLEAVEGGPAGKAGGGGAAGGKARSSALRRSQSHTSAGGGGARAGRAEGGGDGSCTARSSARIGLAMLVHLYCWVSSAEQAQAVPMGADGSGGDAEGGASTTPAAAKATAAGMQRLLRACVAALQACPVVPAPACPSHPVDLLRPVQDVQGLLAGGAPWEATPALDASAAEERYGLEAVVAAAAREYGCVVEEMVALRVAHEAAQRDAAMAAAAAATDAAPTPVGEPRAAGLAAQQQQQAAAAALGRTAAAVARRGVGLLEEWQSALLHLLAYRTWQRQQLAARSDSSGQTDPGIEGRGASTTCPLAARDAADSVRLVCYIKSLHSMLRRQLPWLAPLVRGHCAAQVAPLLAAVVGPLSQGAQASEGALAGEATDAAAAAGGADADSAVPLALGLGRLWKAKAVPRTAGAGAAADEAAPHQAPSPSAASAAEQAAFGAAADGAAACVPPGWPPAHSADFVPDPYTRLRDWFSRGGADPSSSHLGAPLQPVMEGHTPRSGGSPGITGGTAPGGAGVGGGHTRLGGGAGGGSSAGRAGSGERQRPRSAATPRTDGSEEVGCGGGVECTVSSASERGGSLCGSEAGEPGREGGPGAAAAAAWSHDDGGGSLGSARAAREWWHQREHDSQQQQQQQDQAALRASPQRSPGWHQPPPLQTSWLDAGLSPSADRRPAGAPMFSNPTAAALARLASPPAISTNPLYLHASAEAEQLQHHLYQQQQQQQGATVAIWVASEGGAAGSRGGASGGGASLTNSRPQPIPTSRAAAGPSAPFAIPGSSAPRAVPGAAAPRAMPAPADAAASPGPATAAGRTRRRWALPSPPPGSDDTCRRSPEVLPAHLLPPPDQQHSFSQHSLQHPQQQLQHPQHAPAAQELHAPGKKASGPAAKLKSLKKLFGGSSTKRAATAAAAADPSRAAAAHDHLPSDLPYSAASYQPYAQHGYAPSMGRDSFAAAETESGMGLHPAGGSAAAAWYGGAPPPYGASAHHGHHQPSGEWPLPPVDAYVQQEGAMAVVSLASPVGGAGGAGAGAGAGGGGGGKGAAALLAVVQRAREEQSCGRLRQLAGELRARILEAGLGSGGGGVPPPPGAADGAGLPRDGPAGGGAAAPRGASGAAKSGLKRLMSSMRSKGGARRSGDSGLQASCDAGSGAHMQQQEEGALRGGVGEEGWGLSEEGVWQLRSSAELLMAELQSLAQLRRARGKGQDGMGGPSLLALLALASELSAFLDSGLPAMAPLLALRDRAAAAADLSAPALAPLEPWMLPPPPTPPAFVRCETPDQRCRNRDDKRSYQRKRALASGPWELLSRGVLGQGDGRGGSTAGSAPPLPLRAAVTVMALLDDALAAVQARAPAVGQPVVELLVASLRSEADDCLHGYVRYATAQAWTAYKVHALHTELGLPAPGRSAAGISGRGALAVVEGLFQRPAADRSAAQPLGMWDEAAGAAAQTATGKGPGHLQSELLHGISRCVQGAAEDVAKAALDSDLTAVAAVKHQVDVLAAAVARLRLDLPQLPPWSDFWLAALQEAAAVAPSCAAVAPACKAAVERRRMGKWHRPTLPGAGEEGGAEGGAAGGAPSVEDILRAHACSPAVLCAASTWSYDVAAGAFTPTKHTRAAWQRMTRSDGLTAQNAVAAFDAASTADAPPSSAASLAGSAPASAAAPPPVRSFGRPQLLALHGLLGVEGLGALVAALRQHAVEVLADAAPLLRRVHEAYDASPAGPRGPGVRGPGGGGPVGFLALQQRWMRDRGSADALVAANRALQALGNCVAVTAAIDAAMAELCVRRAPHAVPLLASAQQADEAAHAALQELAAADAASAGGAAPTAGRPAPPPPAGTGLAGLLLGSLDSRSPAHGPLASGPALPPGLATAAQPAVQAAALVQERLRVQLPPAFGLQGLWRALHDCLHPLPPPSDAAKRAASPPRPWATAQPPPTASAAPRAPPRPPLLAAGRLWCALAMQLSCLDRQEQVVHAANVGDGVYVAAGALVALEAAAAAGRRAGGAPGGVLPGDAMTLLQQAVAMELLKERAGAAAAAAAAAAAPAPAASGPGGGEAAAAMEQLKAWSERASVVRAKWDAAGQLAATVAAALAAGARPASSGGSADAPAPPVDPPLVSRGAEPWAQLAHQAAAAGAAALRSAARHGAAAGPGGGGGGGGTGYGAAASALGTLPPPPDYPYPAVPAAAAAAAAPHPGVQGRSRSMLVGGTSARGPFNVAPPMPPRQEAAPSLARHSAASAQQQQQQQASGAGARVTSSSGMTAPPGAAGGSFSGSGGGAGSASLQQQLAQLQLHFAQQPGLQPRPQQLAAAQARHLPPEAHHSRGASQVRGLVTAAAGAPHPQAGLFHGHVTPPGSTAAQHRSRAGSSFSDLDIE